MKISSTVVVYNPDEQVFLNIETFINGVDILYIIDNSDKPNENIIEKFKELDKTKYISNNGNLGVAYALNIAVKESISNGYDFLLTMDQDSTPDVKMLENMKCFIKENNVSDIGIIAPVQIFLEGQKINNNKLYEELDMTMTSGNLVNLKILSTIDGFMNDLFIDQIDHEYCLRLRSKGFRVLQLNNAILYHKLGDTKHVNLIVTKKMFISHNPIRIYYLFRNGFYVNKLYKSQFPNFSKYFIRRIISEFIYTILIEKNKIQRFQFMYKGFMDYKKNRFGKYV